MLLSIKRFETSFLIMEDFDGDRWRGTPAADAAYKQEELTGPQQVEREVWSISPAEVLTVTHCTSVTVWEHRDSSWTRQTQSANQHLSAGGNLCHLSSDLWNFGPRWEQQAK